MHHLSLHQPPFSSLLPLPLSSLDPARSWLSLMWCPVLIDLHHEHQLAGYWLSYYRLDARTRGDGGAEEDTAGEGEGEEVRAPQRVRRRREEKGREEGEEEGDEDEEGELRLMGYVASRVDADTWFREGQGEGVGDGEAMGGGGGGIGAAPPLRVSHMDVDAELVAALQTMESVQPDFSFALQYKGR